MFVFAQASIHPSLAVVQRSSSLGRLLIPSFTLWILPIRSYKTNKMVASKAFVAAALVGAAAASAIPAVNTLKQGRSTLHQVKREGHVNNGALSVYKTYLKYKTPIPDWLASAVANSTGIDFSLLKRDEGSATTSPIDTFDDAYVTPVSIGTPAQILNLDFDTGSSDLWVFSSLTASADVDGQDVYTPSDSSTAELLSGETWDISYGDGSSSSGVVYSDTVAIGGVTVTAQAVYVVSLLAPILFQSWSDVRTYNLSCNHLLTLNERIARLPRLCPAPSLRRRPLMGFSDSASTP